MKKRIFLLLLIFCLGLGGCGKKEEQTKKKTTATEEVGHCIQRRNADAFHADSGNAESVAEQRRNG